MSTAVRKAFALSAVALLVVGVTASVVHAASSQDGCTAPSTSDGATYTGTCSYTYAIPAPPTVHDTVTATATVTVTVTGTPSASTSSSPSIPAPSDTPTPTPTPTATASDPPSSVTNGSQITTANTGMAAWVGPLGERCTTPKVYTAKVTASSLGASATCVWFKQGVTFDRDITITAARFDRSIDTNGHTVNLNWVNVDTVSVEDIGIHGEGTFNLYRCTVTGSSDAIRFDGDNVIESYLRVKQASSADHNDAIQAYQASKGGSILRSNIDGRPVDAPSTVYGNAAVFFADNSHGNVDLRDNYLAGGGYTMRLNEAMIYVHVTGNIVAQQVINVKGQIVSGYGYGPVSTSNAVSGAFPDWSSNTLSDGSTLNR